MIERDITVYIHDLAISERNKKALVRIGIMTLNDLERRETREFSDVQGLGEGSIQELNYILDHADDIFIQFETRKQRFDAIYDEVSEIPVEMIAFGTRAFNALKRSQINTVGKMIRMSKKDIAKLRDVGVLTRDEISASIEGIIAEGKAYFEKVAESAPQTAGADEENEGQSEVASQPVGKGFDFPVIDILAEKYAFKPIRMTDWFGLSRQGIYNVIDKRSPKRREIWTGKELIDQEKAILVRLIQDNKFDCSDDEVICCCMNNRQDDFVCLFIYEYEIKCFFLKDLSEELQQMITAANFHRYTERELAGGTEGEVISVLKQKYFSPKDLRMFHSLALSRGISGEDYAQFISGYPYMASRSVTDDTIIAFFEANMVDGKVYISSDPKNQWIRSYASRNGYGIKELIEFFGYESKLYGTELTTDGARERHIEELNQYVVHDKVVYFPTDSRIYRLLSAYTYNKGTSLNEYLQSLGFDRTTERPEVVVDVLEKDMQIRQIDGKFEDEVFAAYPLIGSKILKPEMLEKLNEYAKKYIDMILREPRNKLPLRAEMQITLALINNAKNWKNEENSNFWNYISLQFGYRDTNGAVVHLLQTSLENSMKQNCRLFIEDSNGRAFKSTAVIHALTTRKSWMTLFDFLFDFYKNNLNWKLIPGDPLLVVMIRSLQQKLVGDSSEDAELIISSQVYSFQEGIRKLILLRPVFTRGLFEKLIGKIDAMVNSEDMPVKTYEEQLCEEWFKEKIIAITNTKRSERHVQNVQRDVAIDYSRIRAKLILKNENDVQLVLPDIRLKSGDISRAILAIYYNGSIAHQQNMSWYGNEFGKTLNGVSVSLPDFPGNISDMDIQVRINCDNEEIYNSEYTLSHRVLIFASGNEVSPGQMKRDNYTIVMPQASVLEVENADVTEIDSFKISGLKAYFVELQDGYVLTMDRRLFSFDSVNGIDIRFIPPAEAVGLPTVTAEDTEYYFAYHGSVCSIILGNEDFLQQFIILKDGERIEFSALSKMENGNGLAFTCPITGVDGTCRIQIINLDDERLLFDKSFILISKAECSFNREFYYSQGDYKDAVVNVRIDDFSEIVSFTQEDEEVQVPFWDGELHVSIPKVQIEETTGAWMNGSAPAWFIGDIPQNSLLKVKNPARTEVRFLVGGKDIMYDGQGLVTLGNVLQSFCNTENLSLVEVEMLVSGNGRKNKYLLARVCYKERFLKNPEFWTDDNKLFWNQGGTFIGKAGRTFILTLHGESDTPIEFKLDEITESIAIPADMEIGNYRFEISILSGSLFKKVKEVIAEGDCIVGDQNLLRFRDHRIVVDTITDEFNEEAGHIPIRTCYIDRIEFMGMEDTSEGYCPVYSGIMYTTGYHGERYEFSFDSHTNSRGVTKMMVNPVRIVYVGNMALCITDTDGDGLYYYHYYDRYLENKVYALTDHEYTKANKHKYSNADLYSYRTERI